MIDTMTMISKWGSRVEKTLRRPWKKVVEPQTVGELITAEANRITIEETELQILTSIETIMLKWYPLLWVSVTYDAARDYFEVRVQIEAVDNTDAHRRLDHRLVLDNAFLDRCTTTVESWKKYVASWCDTIHQSLESQMVNTGTSYWEAHKVTRTQRGGWLEVNHDLDAFKKATTAAGDSMKALSERMHGAARDLDLLRAEQLEKKAEQKAVESIQESFKRQQTRDE